MFTEKDAAWTETSADDATVVEAMRAGSQMIVQGKSSQGTMSSDTYSLGGVTEALKAIAKLWR